MAFPGNQEGFRNRVLRKLVRASRLSDLLLKPVFLLYEIPECLPPEADCLVGLAAGLCTDGSPGPITEAVAKRSASFYLSGDSRFIIFTGGFTAAGRTEADVMAQIAMRMGVPEDSIILEKKSLRTHHHPREIEPILQRIGAHSLVIVSHCFHSRRARAIFKKWYGTRYRMHFAKARSDFDLTAQWRYLSGTTCFFWNVGNHVLAKLRGWA